MELHEIFKFNPFLKHGNNNSKGNESCGSEKVRNINQQEESGAQVKKDKKGKKDKKDGQPEEEQKKS